ncbi:MAG: hypothetical protein SNJ70_11165 [Armatimonadota bacterium]
MSEFLQKLSGFLKNSDDPNISMAKLNANTNDIVQLSASIPAVKNSRVVENRDSIELISVGEPEYGKINCFLDGMQRTRTAFYSKGVPIVYAYTAAVIRKRAETRKMENYARPISKEALYIPYKIYDKDIIENAGIATIDTSDDLKEFVNHPAMLEQYAAEKINNTREDLESTLANRWIEENINNDDWIIIDGSLPKIESKIDPSNINAIGMIKSHNTLYFPMEEMSKVFAMQVGQRSSVFIPDSPKKAPVHSWYLRLYPNDGKDPFFGLIRVEVPMCDRTFDIVNSICKWILNEKNPLSLPDMRYDKMLYPIRDCEQYLKSLAPSYILLDAIQLSLKSAFL